MSDNRVDEIEDMIARGELNAAQVFTQMRQLVQARAKSDGGEFKHCACLFRADGTLEKECIYHQSPNLGGAVLDEPTDEMLDACLFSEQDRAFPANTKQYLRRVYRAMMAAAPTAQGQELDMFWDADNPESGGGDIDCVIDDMADNMDRDTSEVFEVMCAKRIPNREILVKVDADGNSEWEWHTPESPKQEGA